MSYEAWLPKAVPSWLRNTTGRRFFTAVGRRMDAVIQTLRDAGAVGWPAEAPADALPYIAHERGLPRWEAETEDEHRARLANAWDLWGGDNTALTGVGGGGGTHLGLLKEIEVMGLTGGATGAVIVQQNGLYAHLDGSGDLVCGELTTRLMNCINRIDLTGAVNSRAGWTFEVRDNFYSQFGILFPDDCVELRTDVAVRAQFNRVVEKWKPSKTMYMGCWVVETGVTLGWPAGARTLGTEPVLGGNSVTFIPGARRHELTVGYHLP